MLLFLVMLLLSVQFHYQKSKLGGKPTWTAYVGKSCFLYLKRPLYCYISLPSFHLRALLEVGDVSVPDFSIFHALPSFCGLKS